MFLGEIIYKFRKEKHLTMEAFANLSGLSKGYISMLEKNKHPQSSRKLAPSMETFKKVANAMGIDAETLVRMTSKDQLISFDELPTPSPFTLKGVTNVTYPTGKPVPILGTICAGNGIWCEENFEGNFFVDESIKADLCVRVKGDSMVDAGIYNGDIAFIKKVCEYESGKIYAVRINSDCEAVLKKITWSDDTVVLSPCNSNGNFTSIITSGKDVSIIGEFIGVYHIAL